MTEFEYINLFWDLFNLAEPYVANNGKRYVEIKAPTPYGHITVNMWCRLIPNVERTLGNTVVMCID